MKQKVFLFLFLSLFSMVSYGEEPKEPSLLDSAWNIAKGAGQCVGDMVCEPFRQLHDTGMAIYFMATDQKEAAKEWEMKGEAKSGFVKAMQAQYVQNTEGGFVALVDRTTGLVKSMGAGIINMPWEMKEAWDEGDYEKAGYLGTSILSIAVPEAYGLKNVTINFPQNAIRFIPVAAGENQFALAAVSIQTITIEGLAIHEGVVLGILMRPNPEPPSDYEKPIRWVKDGDDPSYSKNGHLEYEDGRPVDSNHPGRQQLQEGKPVRRSSNPPEVQAVVDELNKLRDKEQNFYVPLTQKQFDRMAVLKAKIQEFFEKYGRIEY